MIFSSLSYAQGGFFMSTKCNFIISYDFSKLELNDSIYNELQPKVSAYLNEVLGEQILNNLWYKHWTFGEMNNFRNDYQENISKLLPKEIFDNNFGICICEIHRCYCHPKCIKTKITMDNLFT